MAINFPYIYGGGSSGGNFSFTTTGKFQYPAQVTVPKTVTSLTGDASGFYQHAEIEEITFESGGTLSTIANNAFYYCTGLRKVTLPSTITAIGNTAFQACAALAQINLPEGLTTMGANAFSSCAALSSVVLPSTLTNIGSAFNGCTGLTSISIPGTLVTVSANAFNGCTALADITIAEGVESILNFAFQRSIPSEIVLPASLSTIGACAFAYNTNLTRVVLKSCPLASDGPTITNNNYWWSSNYPFTGCSNIEDFVIPSGWDKDINLGVISSKLTHDSLVALLGNLADFTGGTQHVTLMALAKLLSHVAKHNHKNNTRE